MNTHQIRNSLNHDGTKSLYILGSGNKQIEILTYFSQANILIDLLTSNVNDINFIQKPYKDPFILAETTYTNVIALTDASNVLYFLNPFSTYPSVIYKADFSDMINGNRHMIEIPTLPDKHKFRKSAFYEDQNKHFAYDMRLRIAVYVDNQGLCCVINTHYKTRKYVYLEDKYKVKDIHIMP